ncbi:MAG: hypothetical protein AXW14_14935 [Alteromonas sp. Nap_26]|nr:MAG: hypothetical protein AXW14_14935 [Alteromonas sp. Nap_26]
MQRSNFYLVTGFHRSGTSLVAKTLLDSGINMGSTLLGASFANPYGHVEDCEIVEFHDEILCRNNSDWRFFGEVELNTTDEDVKRLKKYLARRRKLDGPIGVKDPRAINFLELWNEASEGTLKTIVVFRDWRLSVSSILKRHSREFFNHIDSASNRKEDYSFWQFPDLAAQMWLTAAEKAIDWYNKHSENVILFNLEQFIDDKASIVSVLPGKNIPHSIFEANPSDRSVLQNGYLTAMLQMISPSLIEKCENALRNLKSISPPSPANTGIANELTIDKSLASLCKALIMRESNRIKTPSLLPSTALKKETSDIEKEIPKESHMEYEECYWKAIRLGDTKSAECFLHRANILYDAPWRWMYLGDIYFNKKNMHLAELCYVRASELQPSNATFYAKLVQLHCKSKNREKAEKLIKHALHLDNNNPTALLAYKAFTEAFNVSETTIDTSQEKLQQNSTRCSFMPFPPPYSEIIELQKTQKNFSRAIDNYNVFFNFLTQDVDTWFNDALTLLPPQSRECFLEYTLSNLGKVVDTQSLAAAFEFEDIGTYELNQLPERSIDLGLRIGVHIHAFYISILPEILLYLKQIHIEKIVITCLHEDVNKVKVLTEKQANIIIKAVPNKGRDILPWLNISPILSSCDIVIKLHTKSSPHASHLKQWRLQLLWSLIETNNIQSIMKAFKQDKNLGVVIPDYHPALHGDINWGMNLEKGKQLAHELNILIPDEMEKFPAGSMFVYRPDALVQLNQLRIGELDIEEELGQQDGTFMHALERLIIPLCESGQYDAKYTSELPNHMLNQIKKLQVQ